MLLIIHAMSPRSNASFLPTALSPRALNNFWHQQTVGHYKGGVEVWKASCGSRRASCQYLCRQVFPYTESDLTSMLLGLSAVNRFLCFQHAAISQRRQRLEAKAGHIMPECQQGGCQNDGPLLGPYSSTAPSI